MKMFKLVIEISHNIHIGFVVTHAHERKMYSFTLLVPMYQISPQQAEQNLILHLQSLSILFPLDHL